MTHESLGTLWLLCLGGSVAITAFMAVVAWGYGIDWSLRETGLTAVVCAAFCYRAITQRQVFLANNRDELARRR